MGSPGSEVVAAVVSLGHALRAEGIVVGSAQMIDCCRAVAIIGPEQLYWSGRLTLVASPDDVAAYDRIYANLFGGPQGAGEVPLADQQPNEVRMRSGQLTADTGTGAPSDLVAGVAADGGAGEGDAGADIPLATPFERLHDKSFADYTEDELAEIAALCRHVFTVTRRSRRYRRANAGLPDLRRTLRASFHTAGEPVERAWRSRRMTQRRVTLILDVSASMAAYSRALLSYAHAGVRTQQRWEVFCFATRLTRVTDVLASATPDVALQRATAEVVDWNGGTRIGECLGTLLDSFASGRALRGAVVVICSDGLETGDPDVLAERVARLSRLAHRLVWVNPLKEDPAYEPLARGMRAALPHVDAFASGHSLAGLEAVAMALSAAGTRAKGTAAWMS